jgi:hypothetical protein
MKEKFREKLKKDQRNFKWFFDNYIKGKHENGLAYNTLYQQASGVFLKNMSKGLESAIKEYLEEK